MENFSQNVHDICEVDTCSTVGSDENREIQFFFTFSFVVQDTDIKIERW
jgi:hypothetical protein